MFSFFLFVFIGIAGRLRWAYGRVFFFLFVPIAIAGRCGHPLYVSQVAALEYRLPVLVPQELGFRFSAGLRPEV